ncbi:MAG: VOC family protein [Cyclobacteriaceae bacterium]
MILEHVAIWTYDLEKLKDFYVQLLGAKASEKYVNLDKDFHSYFLSFNSGARIEIMYMPGIPNNSNDIVHKQHQGIIHLAFGCKSVEEVEAKAKEFREAGFPILKGPRETGDGYFEFETLDPDNNRLEVTVKL